MTILKIIKLFSKIIFKNSLIILILKFKKYQLKMKKEIKKMKIYLIFKVFLIKKIYY